MSFSFDQLKEKSLVELRKIASAEGVNSSGKNAEALAKELSKKFQEESAATDSGPDLSSIVAVIVALAKEVGADGCIPEDWLKPSKPVQKAVKPAQKAKPEVAVKKAPAPVEEEEAPPPSPAKKPAVEAVAKVEEDEEEETPPPAKKQAKPAPKAAKAPPPEPEDDDEESEEEELSLSDADLAAMNLVQLQEVAKKLNESGIGGDDEVDAAIDDPKQLRACIKDFCGRYADSVDSDDEDEEEVPESKRSEVPEWVKTGAKCIVEVEDEDAMAGTVVRVVKSGAVLVELDDGSGQVESPLDSIRPRVTKPKERK